MLTRCLHQSVHACLISLNYTKMMALNYTKAFAEACRDADAEADYSNVADVDTRDCLEQSAIIDPSMLPAAKKSKFTETFGAGCGKFEIDVEDMLVDTTTKFPVYGMPGVQAPRNSIYRVQFRENQPGTYFSIWHAQPLNHRRIFLIRRKSDDTNNGLHVPDYILLQAGTQMPLCNCVTAESQLERGTRGSPGSGATSIRAENTGHGYTRLSRSSRVRSRDGTKGRTNAYASPPPTRRSCSLVAVALDSSPCAMKLKRFVKRDHARSAWARSAAGGLLACILESVQSFDERIKKPPVTPTGPDPITRTRSPHTRINTVLIRLSSIHARGSLATPSTQPLS